MVVIANVGVVGERKLILATLAFFDEETHHRLRLFDRQGTQQCVEDAEDRSVYTNSKRERRDNDEAEARALR